MNKENNNSQAEGAPMTLAQYQQQAMTTCLPESENFSYMMLNLVGEVGELASKVAKMIRRGQVVFTADGLSFDEGRSYLRWVKNVCSYGYNYDWRLLNAADFGAYTSRKRFFGQFALHGLPIAFPKATHAKCPAKYEHSLFPADNMQPWKPVREVLDLNDEGESIFGRKKPLVEKTLERIYAGLIKFVAGGKEAFIVKWNSVNGKTGKYVPPSIDEPCPTVATQNRLGVAKVQFLSKQFGGDPAGKNISVEEPAGTITCRDHHAFVSAHYGNGFNTSVDAPAPTLTCKDRLGLVTSKFIVNYRFNNNGSSIEKPAPTICTVEQLSVADCKFLANEYSGGGQLSSIEQPNPAVMTTPKQKLVSVKQLVMKVDYTKDKKKQSQVIPKNKRYYIPKNKSEPLFIQE